MKDIKKASTKRQSELNQKAIMIRYHSEGLLVLSWKKFGWDFTYLENQEKNKL